MSEVWEIDEKDRRVGGLVIATPTGNGGRSPVAMVFTKRGFGNFELAKRRAKLTSAAPELLAALEVVVNDWTAQFERQGHMAPAWCKQARAAIAKATQ